MDISIPGLLAAIDRTKQQVKSSLGLLVDNPQEWVAGRVEQYLPTKSEEKEYRALNKAGASQKELWNTPYAQKMFNLAQFQGSIKPVGNVYGLLNGADPVSSIGMDDWFKNSKVVDENGSPIVAYKAMSGDIPHIQEQTGMTHVAFDKAVANSFSSKERPVKEVFVRSEKPFDFRNSQDISWLAQEMAKPENVKAFNDQTKKIMGDGYSYVVSPRELRGSLESGAYQAYEVPVVIGHIRNRGYDGIYMVEEGEQFRQPNLAVFSPDQIKIKK